MDEGPYLSTEQVARRLGVKPETVYAYVSRGLLTSIRGTGRRGSRFAAAEVDRLASRGREQRPAGAVERIRTAVTLLDGDSLYYRGKDATDLARTSSVEAVAAGLWTGDFTTAEPFPVSPVAAVVRACAALPADARLVDRIRLSMDVLGALDPLRFDLSAGTSVRIARSLVGCVVAALPTEAPLNGDFVTALWSRLTTHPAHPACVAILRAALILLADHDLAVSTLAVRVAASSRANLYAALSAGLGAFDGQLHGTVSTLAYRFLAEAVENPLAALSNHLRTGRPLPGFGHRVYTRRDPRADLLLDMLADVRHRSARAVSGAVADIRDARPETFANVDVALGAMMHAFDMRSDAGEAIFATARLIGWTAHAIEEYAEEPLRFRPSGVYVGTAPISS
ncbi:citrate synthase [Fodinicola acaciae]|uniref:citrate synthase n=1 Tax=Fodinicola acaciae TaxID=2681555 RepID=UPI0013D66134|nr:citrate synthase [Fodinicola acaciae]